MTDATATCRCGHSESEHISRCNAWTLSGGPRGMRQRCYCVAFTPAEHRSKAAAS